MPQPPGSRPLPDLPAVIGHRGAAGSAPENTLASFRRAAELGVLWVECDLRATADGQAVLLHDASLDRTSAGRDLLARRTVAELAGIDAGSWFGAAFAGERIPTLAQALACWQELGLGANLELKTEDGSAEVLAGAVAAALAAAPAVPPLLLSSFEAEALSAARRRLPQLPRGLLVSELDAAGLESARALGCASIHASAARLQPAQVAAARAQGLEVLAYTVNDAAAAQRLWSWGVRSVFSDFPERLKVPA